MKDGSQTRSGADTPRAELLKPKNKIRVGSWNVRTLYQAGKLQQVLREMENYKVELLCVSEARWIDSGKRTLSSGHTILYSGRSDNQHRGGVAIIVTRKVEKNSAGVEANQQQTTQGKIQFQVCKADSDRMLCTNRGCRGGDQG